MKIIWISPLLLGMQGDCTEGDTVEKQKVNVSEGQNGVN
jgi:hypothetical protein